MDIVIFKEITTNDYLSSLQTESEKYTGLYVDMDNAPERKYVKDKAHDIKELLKKIDRKRIDASKEFKVKVEKEAADIIEKLKTANEPFTLLINDYTAERAKVLTEEKRIKDERVAALQLEDDHDDAISLNRLFDLEAGERARLKQEQDDQLKVDAIEQTRKTIELEAIQKERELEIVRQQEEQEEQAALAKSENIQHRAKVNNIILAQLLDNGFDEHEAKKFIKLAAQNKLTQLTINY